MRGHPVHHGLWRGSVDAAIRPEMSEGEVDLEFLTMEPGAVSLRRLPEVCIRLPNFFRSPTCDDFIAFHERVADTPMGQANRLKESVSAPFPNGLFRQPVSAGESSGVDELRRPGFCFSAIIHNAY